MSKYTRVEIDRLIDAAAKRAAKEVAKEAAEDAVALYNESLDDKFKLVNEASDFIIEELAKKPNRDEFDELKADVATLKHALTATNQDLQSHDKRLTTLENTVYHA